MSPEPFVTADEVAQHLKITRRQVLAMARRNLLPGHPICFDRGRRMWRFKLSEVDKTIASRTGESGVAVPPACIRIAPGSPRSQKEQHPNG
jgi:hypothetical protein